MPKVTLVIGGNGAGKSTWCQRKRNRHRLPTDFYNPDAVAEGLGDANRRAKQRTAAELISRAIRGHLERGEDFGVETTFAGRTRPRLVEQARELGYETMVVFIGTRDPEINVQRIALRAATKTGHAVDPATTRRRWKRAQEHLIRTAKAIASIELVDNSGRSGHTVARIENGIQIRQYQAAPPWARELATRIEEAASEPRGPKG